MSHMGGCGRRRFVAIAALALALCVAAPELGGVAAAATPSSGSSASKPTGVVLVARRRTRSQVERARFRAYLRRHPNVLVNKIRKHPGLYARYLRKRKGKYAAKRTQKAGKRKRHAAARHKKRATAKKRRRAAAVGAAAAHKKKGGSKSKKSSKSSGKSLSWSDWAGIALLVLAPFAAVALLLYITDLRRRPRAPSRTKRRRSLVITPHKS
jgi:hypothetical protein